jgi:hypothetical protein
MYLLFSLRTTDRFSAYSMPMFGLVGALIALFEAAPVSTQAFVMAILINVLLVITILRASSILNEVSPFAFLLQLCMVSRPSVMTDVDPYPDFLDSCQNSGRYGLVEFLS